MVRPGKVRLLQGLVLLPGSTLEAGEVLGLLVGNPVELDALTLVLLVIQGVTGIAPTSTSSWAS